MYVLIQAYDLLVRSGSDTSLQAPLAAHVVYSCLRNLGMCMCRNSHPSLSLSRARSLSLSLSYIHTYIHTYIYIYTC